MFEILGVGGRVKYLLDVPTPSWLCYELALEKWQRLDLFHFRRKGFVDILKLLKAYLSSPGRLQLPADSHFNFGESGSLVAFVTSINQYRVLEKLLPASCKKVAIFPEPFSDYNLLDSVSMQQIEFFGMKYVPLILLELILTTSKYKRRSIFHFFREYVQAYGMYRILSEHPFFRNRVIVYSNDHSPLTRAIGLVNPRAYTSIYVPHANVSSDFPPLEMDVAFLFGEHMKEKYGVGKAKVVLLGNPLFDDIPKVPLKQILSRPYVGFCVNLLDSTRLVVDMIEGLSSMGVKILFRSHPSDNRDWGSILAHFPSVCYSNAKLVNVKDFLGAVRIVLSGPSSVLIDAWGAGIHSFQIKISEKSLIDNYGIISEGYIEMLNTLEDVKSVLDNLENIYLEKDPRKLGGHFYHNCRSDGLLTNSIFEKCMEELQSETN